MLKCKAVLILRQPGGGYTLQVFMSARLQIDFKGKMPPFKPVLLTSATDEVKNKIVAINSKDLLHPRQPILESFHMTGLQIDPDNCPSIAEET